MQILGSRKKIPGKLWELYKHLNARTHKATDSQARSIESKNTQSVNLVRRAGNPRP